MRQDIGIQLQSGQQLVMTPLLQRAIQYLQLSSLEFMQEVAETATDNPFLEEGDSDEPGSAQKADPAGSAEAEAGGDTADGDEPSTALDSEPLATALPAEDGAEHLAADESASMSDARDDIAERYGADDYGRGGGSFDNDDDYDPLSRVAAATSLREHLRQQAGCLNLSDSDRIWVESVIDSIEPSGYLMQSLEEIAAAIDPQSPPLADLEIALLHVQAMEPAGVGARSVAECLRLQLLARDLDEPGRGCALKMLDHLDLFAARDFQRMQKELDCDPDSMAAATVLIRKLEPKPGARFGGEAAHFIAPEVIVRKVGGKWTAAINPRVVPRIRMNQVYADIMRGSRGATASRIGEKLSEARWLLRNIEQRFDTILRVAQEIVSRQSRYFEYGDVAMRPLTLHEVAESLGLHESTVSRVTSRKFMSTPRGVLEFKHFFGSHVVTDQGNPCSSTAVRALIRQMVTEESPQDPHSDVTLTRMLARQGIKVARRTVSKYRGALDIPPVEIRRMAGMPTRQPDRSPYERSRL